MGFRFTVWEWRGQENDYRKYGSKVEVKMVRGSRQQGQRVRESWEYNSQSDGIETYEDWEYQENRY